MKKHLSIIAAALLASSAIAIAQDGAAGGAASGGTSAGGSATSAPSAAPDATAPTTSAPATSAPSPSGGPAASGGVESSTRSGGSIQGGSAEPAPRADSPQAPSDRNQDAAQRPSNETTASISQEQRSELQSAFGDAPGAQPVDVDVDVRLGVVIPSTVTLQPLPPRIVEIVPAYDGYRYFVLADGRIVIVEPATMKVVYIVTA